MKKIITIKEAQKFAKEMSQILYEMRVEGDFFNDSYSEIPDDFIDSIVDDPLHARLIKTRIRNAILRDCAIDPRAFERDDDGNLTYYADMYNYCYHVDDYVNDRWNELHPVQPTDGWMGLSLSEIIEEYKDGDNSSLDRDDVDRICDIIKAKINLIEGNITVPEYELAMNYNKNIRL